MTDYLRQPLYNHWYFKCNSFYIDSRSNNRLLLCWSFMYSARKSYPSSSCFCVGNLLDDLRINNSLDTEGNNYEVPGIENKERDYLAYSINTTLTGYIYYWIQLPICGSFLFPTWINGPKFMLMLYAMISTLATTSARCNFKFWSSLCLGSRVLFTTFLLFFSIGVHQPVGLHFSLSLQVELSLYVSLIQEISLFLITSYFYEW